MVDRVHAVCKSLVKSWKNLKARDLIDSLACFFSFIINDDDDDAYDDLSQHFIWLCQRVCSSELTEPEWADNITSQ